MKSIKIKNIASTLTGFAFDSKKFNDSKGFPIIRIRDLKQGATQTFYDGDFDQRYLIKRGDLLIGMDGEFNLVEWTSNDALLNQRVCKLIVDETKADKTYIKYALPKKLKEIEDVTPFVTVKHLSNKQVLEIEIPLPDLQTQKQIAQVLEDADRARQQRKAANVRTEQFLQSSFLHLFGDLVTNEKNWQTMALKETESKIQIGPFGTQLHAEDYIEDGIPLINPKNIQNSKIVADRKLTVAKAKYDELSNYHLRTSDIIMGRRGEMGRCALVTENENGWFCGTGSLFIRPAKIFDPTFLLFVLTSNSIKERLEHQAQGVTMANLNQSIINELVIPVPPLSLQQHFASLVANAETLHQKQQQSEKELEHLFQALLQKYFSSGVANSNTMEETLSQAAEPEMKYAAQESE